MNYRASFTIPAATAKGAAVTQDVLLAPGILSHTRIRIPWGHAALAHLRIYRWNSQLFPITPGADFIGNDEEIDISDPYLIAEVPYTLTLWGYNEDEEFPHTFELIFTVIRPTLFPTAQEVVGQIIPLESLGLA